MRIGEIAIIGPHAPTKREFIRNVCDEVLIQTDDLIFGRLQINSQLVLHLYGVNFIGRNQSPSWDLVSQKLLGYILLFNWDRLESFDSVKRMVDELSTVEKQAVVVAANMQGDHETIPIELLNTDINLSTNTEFTFCDVSNKEVARQTIVILLDTVLEKMD